MQDLFHGERGERRGLQHVVCRAAGVSQRGDRRAGLAPRGCRRGAEAEQGDLELRACGLPGGQSLLGAAQDRRSLGRATAEEEHAAELDRRRRDSVGVRAAVDDLRQRVDRLGCTGAGERQAEVEHDSGAVAVGRRLVQRAGEQRGRFGGVAQAQRVASRIPQQRHRLQASPAGSVCMTCAATWPAGAPRSRRMLAAAWCIRSRSAGDRSS